MSIRRSDNCSSYTDTVSLLVDSKVTVPGEEDRCTVSLPPTFSCQTKAFEAPDATTTKTLADLARTTLEERGCDANRMQLHHVTNLIGAQAVEYSGAKLSELGMASNCYAHGNDPNDASHVVEARCYPMFDMTDAHGRTVRDYHKRVIASLVACDVSDEAMPQLMEDTRKVAAYQLEQSGFTLQRPEDLACDVGVLPRL